MGSRSPITIKSGRHCRFMAWRAAGDIWKSSARDLCRRCNYYCRVWMFLVLDVDGGCSSWHCGGWNLGSRRCRAIASTRLLCRNGDRSVEGLVWFVICWPNYESDVDVWSVGEWGYIRRPCRCPLGPKKEKKKRPLMEKKASLVVERWIRVPPAPVDTVTVGLFASHAVFSRSEDTNPLSSSEPPSPPG
jgi:hypothetical protein